VDVAGGDLRPGDERHPGPCHQPRARRACLPWSRSRPAAARPDEPRLLHGAREGRALREEPVPGWTASAPALRAARPARRS
jgi:hypothetical protein